MALFRGPRLRERCSQCAAAILAFTRFTKPLADRIPIPAADTNSGIAPHRSREAAKECISETSRGGPSEWLHVHRQGYVAQETSRKSNFCHASWSQAIPCPVNGFSASWPAPFDVQKTRS